MRYIKEVLLKNRMMMTAYVAIGIFNSFMANFKADYFQKVVDGLTDGTLVVNGIIIYGIIIIINYSMNYLDQYPAKKLEHGVFLDFKLFALNKISRTDYLEYQKIGIGKLVQIIEN